MVAILIMSAKLTILGFLEIKIFSIKVYYVIIYVHDDSIKILSRDSSYIVDVFM